MTSSQSCSTNSAAGPSSFAEGPDWRGGHGRGLSNASESESAGVRVGRRPAVSTRRNALVLLLGLGIGACGGDTTTVEVTATDVEAVARGIHDRVITIDTHDDIPFNFATREVDPGVRAARQVDLPKMREGGLDVGFFIVYVGQGQNSPEGYAQAYAQAITKFEAIHRMTSEMYPPAP